MLLRVSDIEFVKEQYNLELEQRDKLINRISINLGLLTFIFTALIFHIERLADKGCSTDLMIFTTVVVVFLLLIAIIKSCYYLFKAFTGYEYLLLPDIETLEYEESEVVKHYEEFYDTYYREHHNGEDIESLISYEMNQRMLSFYRKGCVTNRKLNLKRAEYSVLMTRWVLQTFLFATLLIMLPIFPLVVESIKYIIINVI